MKIITLSLFAALIFPNLANAYTVSWKQILKENSAGNYSCVAKSCTEGSPIDDSVNCKNFSDIMFAFGNFKNDQSEGYAWFTWNVDGPTSDDWEQRREFTIDGTFNPSGFLSHGDFKTPRMGSNGRVPVKSVAVAFLPPVGAEAHATVDLGGTAPLQIDLECCKDGLCDSENPVDPSKESHDQIFQNPPRLCPSAPKAARDACLAEVAAGQNR